MHTARPSVRRVAAAAAVAAAAVVAARRDAPCQETNERRSSCPLGAQWKRRSETIAVAVTASWILDNWPLLHSPCLYACTSNLATEFGVIDVIAHRHVLCVSGKRQDGGWTRETWSR